MDMDHWPLGVSGHWLREHGHEGDGSGGRLRLAPTSSAIRNSAASVTPSEDGYCLFLSPVSRDAPPRPVVCVCRFTGAKTSACVGTPSGGEEGAFTRPWGLTVHVHTVPALLVAGRRWPGDAKPVSRRSRAAARLRASFCGARSPATRCRRPPRGSRRRDPRDSQPARGGHPRPARRAQHGGRLPAQRPPSRRPRALRAVSQSLALSSKRSGRPGTRNT